MAFALLNELKKLLEDHEAPPAEASTEPHSSSGGCGTIVQTLFAARTQAHRLHLLTSSFAQHKALEDFYEGIIPLVDKFAEAAQGRYSQLMTDILSVPPAVKFSADVCEFKDQLCDFVCTYGRDMLPPNDTVLANIFDEIAALVFSLKYKLENLS